MAAVGPPDPDGQLRLLCQALNEAGVAYVVFGSHAARLHGAPLEYDDVDVDLKPARMVDQCGLIWRSSIAGPGGELSGSRAAVRPVGVIPSEILAPFSLLQELLEGCGLEQRLRPSC